MSDEDFDPDRLDPGIRYVVLLLRSYGFQTTDSGDGISKLAEGLEADSVPHVHMVCKPEDAVAAARRLALLVESFGYAHEPGRLYVVAQFEPPEPFATLSLFGLNDSMLHPRLRTKPPADLGSLDDPTEGGSVGAPPCPRRPPAR